MASDLEQAIDKTRRSYDALYNGLSRHRADWQALRPQDDQVDYAELINDGDWRGLASAASTKLTEYRRVARQLVVARTLIAKQFEVNRVVAPVFEREFVPPHARPDWTEFSRDMRRDLADRGLTRGQIARAIKALSALRSDTLVDEHHDRLLSADESLAPFARRCFAGLMGAHLAGSVAEFNRAARSRVDPPRDAAGFPNRTFAALARAERGYLQTLQRGRIPDVDLMPNDDLRKRLSDATRHAAHLAARRLPKPSAADNRTALEVGDAIRALLRHYALRYQLVWVGAAPPKSPEVSEWSRAASSPFASAARPPRRGSLTNLSARPRSTRAGTNLTIEGLLVAVDVEHVARKPISIVTVRDGRGHEATVVAKYRKLDSSGMVPGSYVRIAGEWSHGMREVRRPVLVLDRLALNELGEDSWTDWVTARIRTIYEPTPQAIAAGWSWQLGTNGAGNPLRYRVWYAPERRP